MDSGAKRPSAPVHSILLVEDEVHLSEMTAAMLERFGFNVFQASDSREAANLWDSDHQSIDLLLADILLPSGIGPEIAVDFRKTKPSLRVIFTSGSDRRLVVETAHMVRGAKFIRKPYTVKGLLDLVRSELAQSHEEKNNPPG
jgi:DNA-binding response OmpR family regulator